MSQLRLVSHIMAYKMILNLKHLIENVSDEKNTLKKEILKIVILRNLLLKNDKKKKWINVYNNFRFFKEKKCEIYFEDIKNKKVQVFKLLSGKTKHFMEKVSEELATIDFDMFEEKIYVLNVEDFSEDMLEMDKQVKELLR